jgi:hypothetical protein
VSAPSAASASSFVAERPIARTRSPAASRRRTISPPVRPVAPITAIIFSSAFV